MPMIRQVLVKMAAQLCLGKLVPRDIAGRFRVPQGAAGLSLPASGWKRQPGDFSFLDQWP